MDNMIVHPDVSGTLTLDLKNVSTENVLATVRHVHGYQYRDSHGVYQVFPARMRSQVFNVDYIDIERKGGSRTRVSSGQVTQAAQTGNQSSNRWGKHERFQRFQSANITTHSGHRSGQFFGRAGHHQDQG